MCNARKCELDADVVLPTDPENANGRAYWSTSRLVFPQFAAMCAAQWEPCDTRIWKKCDDGWATRNATRGGWQGSRAMQVMFVLGLESRSWTRADLRASDALACKMA